MHMLYYTGISIYGEVAPSLRCEVTAGAASKQHKHMHMYTIIDRPHCTSDDDEVCPPLANKPVGYNMPTTIIALSYRYMHMYTSIDLCVSLHAIVVYDLSLLEGLLSMQCK